MPPSFTTNPKLLSDPRIFPLTQPIYAGAPGVYYHGGHLFWVCLDFTTGDSNAFITAYRSDDNGQSQFMTRISPASSIPVAATGSLLGVAWDGNARLCCAYVDTSIDLNHGNINVVIFDMSGNGGLGAFGTPDDTGITIASPNGIRSTWGFLLANGNTQIVYDYFSSGTWKVQTVVKSGSWGSPVVVGTPASSANPPLMGGAQILSSGLGVYWASHGGNISYSVLSGTSVSSTTIVGTEAGLLTIQNLPQTVFYDSASDTVVACVMRNVGLNTEADLLLSSPSASPVCSIVTVGTDPGGNTFSWGTVSASGNPSGSLFYVFAWDTNDNIIQVWQATALTGPWTGPTTFYDEAAHPPIPAPTAPETFPVWSGFPNGELAVTLGLNTQAGSGITSFSSSNRGSGYAVNDTGTVNGGTIQATYRVLSIFNNTIDAFSIHSGGTSYAINDTGTVNGGSTLATYKVTSVGGGGVVTGMSLTLTGAGYSVSSNVGTTDGGFNPGIGAGLTIDISSVLSGTINALLIVTPGQGYVPASNVATTVGGSQPGSGSGLVINILLVGGTICGVLAALVPAPALILNCP